MLILSLAVSAFPPAASAQSEAVFELLNRINALRVASGQAPLELNDQLIAAAQRHSQDMANTGNVSHTGSDGSGIEQRIRDSGYGPTFPAWGENIYGGGLAPVEDAWSFWTHSTVHRNNLLNERYREIGIGVVTSASGTYFTLTFGARPGVLPFFVDQGSLLTSPEVTLTLSNEEATPDNGSSGTMGRAVEIRVGAGEDLSAAAWQVWQRSMPFTLPNVVGQHRITVEYRDADNTVTSYFRIVSLASTQPQLTPAATATFTATALAPTDTPTATTTLVPTDTPVPTSTPTAQPSATFTATASPTATRVEATRATATLRSTPPPTALIPSPTSEPSSQSDLSVDDQETPAPSPTTTRASPASTPAGVESDRAPVERIAAQGWSDAPLDMLGLIAGLQIGAIVLGAAVLIRRSIKS
ncbi:MAG TPA: CAP domain-containing protein [Anaerolineae bacterium]|nr:CAP domain-containing protein [Anaerolineae bacterium]